MVWTAVFRRTFKVVVVSALAAGGGTLGYGLAHQHVAGKVYLERLEALAGEYENLREQYNQAVRRTAVTELLVEDGELSVVIRTADGRDRRFQTSFDPSREIYCDYALVDGRLWIRRVYDDLTAPADGIVITPGFEVVDWNDPAAAHGHAIYRSLSEGRWVVTVSGDGSLALEKAEGEPRAPLTPAPSIGDYEELKRQAREEVGDIGPVEVFRRLTE